MEGIVYKFVNKLNGKVYIGQTTNWYYRYNAHKNSNSNSLFHKAIREDGFENFYYEILFRDSFEDTNAAKIVLEDRERQAILDHMSWDPKYGYNKSIGTGSSGTKWQRSDEWKKMMSAVHKGKVVSIETRKKLSQSLKGRKAWNKGTSTSCTTKKKLSDSHIKYKNIQQYDIDGTLLGEYESALIAEQYSGCSKDSIIRQLKGITKKPKKYIWKIKE